MCTARSTTCYKCGQLGHYAPQCPQVNKNKPKCFNCGSTEHQARNCPKPTIQGGNRNQQNNNTAPQVAGAGGQSRPTARAFNLTMRDAVASQDVVTGIIPINTLNAYVLFDSGATCSFVSNSFAENLKMPCVDLDTPFTVEVANNALIPVKTVYKNCNVEIKGHNFLVNLIPIQLGEFDIILGMDWLVNHHAMIDCNRKRVTLMTSTKSKVVFTGSSSPKQSRCLSVMQAKRLLRKGGTGYLAYIVDTRKEGVELDQIPVVWEFSNVFPYELLGLPPDREIEFVIDLAPGTAPVSKAPYRMALVELKKLLVQL